jgi:CubicO group peptidase (beta-lactamase class C family)
MTDGLRQEGRGRLAEARTHLPRAEDFLLWPPCLQSHGYRMVDRLFATRTIQRGARARSMPRGPEIEPHYEVAGVPHDIPRFMDRNNVAGLLVIEQGRIVLERYGLGLRPADRWSTMSTVKSMTAMLVGAALQDGSIRALDDQVQWHLPSLAGTAYDGVLIRHLLTMSSGVQWSEDYTDRQSEVNRYSKSLADKVPGGVLALLRTLPRAHAPGTVWSYNTGDTYLLGALLAAATGSTLAAYMQQKIWQPCGMEFDAYYTLESEQGQEIGGSRAGMALRDFGRFAQFVLDDGVVEGLRVLPPGWVDQCASRAFEIPAQFGAAHRKSLGLTGYGFSWWLRDDGAMLAMGHSGQRIFIDRERQLAIVCLCVYPEPMYVSPADHDRDLELAGLIDGIRGLADR